jgi:hypothetical protein
MNMDYATHSIIVSFICNTLSSSAHATHGLEM